MIKGIINGISVEVKEGATILDAAQQAQVKIPTLCKHPAVAASAACGICIVRVKATNRLLRACCTPFEDGMEIITHDADIVDVRKTVLELILSTHPNDCLRCGRNNNCELQTLVSDFAIREESFEKNVRELPKDISSGTIEFEPSKCIKCGRCVEVCQNVQDVWALSFLERGHNTRISPAGDITLKDSPCVRCGQCSAHCPTGAIFEHDETQKVWKVLNDPEMHCVVQIAPAVRVAIGEPFGFAPGTNMTAKLYSLLRRLGFDGIFDTNFGADVTIMEEGSEFLERLVHGKGALPLITSCCPAWVDFMEKHHDDMIENFSTCKSPHEIVGVLTKTYYAKKNNIDPSKVFVVSIMPCTAKKYEISRNDDMFVSGYQDVDVSLTTRELARMIKQAGIDVDTLPDAEADTILGAYTGAGTIFANTGGVMEAALRTVYSLVTKKELDAVEFKDVRGFKGIKEATIHINDAAVNVAVAHGLANVEYVLNKVREAKEKGQEPPYHFIEVMACPGGCICGGGQPYAHDLDIREKRAYGIYSDDEGKQLRCSHENPFVTSLYKEFLDKPLSHVAHKLCHTHYTARKKYKK